MIVLSMKLLLPFVTPKIPYFQVIGQLFVYFLLYSPNYILSSAALVSPILVAPALSVESPISNFLYQRKKNSLWNSVES